MRSQIDALDFSVTYYSNFFYSGFRFQIYGVNQYTSV